VARLAPRATLAKVFSMIDSRCALRAAVALAALAGAAQAAEPALVARLEQAARGQLVRLAAGASLVEPEFEVTVPSPRAAPACRQPLTIEPLDTRAVARMRFAVQCPDSGGWRYEYVVRARVTAMVAVTAAPVAAGQQLAEEDLVLERRDVSAIGDSIGALEMAGGQASRRSLRAGAVLRQGQLGAPVLVRRGQPVVMVARHEQVEVSTAGEALDSGARDAVVRVRNSANGKVVRMRVTGAGTVEPVDLPALIR
jgi:flagella basal body P-ring formation protein FlgA